MIVFISIAISVLSLLLSLISILRGRYKIDVLFEENLKWVTGIGLDDGSILMNEHHFLYTRIKIINSSEFDIGYFNLFAQKSFDDHPINLRFESIFNSFNNLKSKHSECLFLYNDDPIVSYIPKSNCGNLRARSVTYLDVIFPLTDDALLNEEIVIGLNLVKKKPFINKWTKNYEIHYRNFQVDIANRPGQNPQPQVPQTT